MWLAGLDQPLRPCLPQTSSPFTWPRPTPQTQGHVLPGCSACGERLEVRGKRTPRAGCVRPGASCSPHGAPQPCPQIGWWPPPIPKSAHSPCLAGPLCSNPCSRRQGSHPTRAPMSAPGSPAALRNSNKEIPSQGVSSNQFLFVPGHRMVPTTLSPTLTLPRETAVLCPP